MKASHDPVVQIADKLVDRAHVLTLLANGIIDTNGAAANSLATFAWLRDDIGKLVDSLEGLHGIDRKGGL